MSSAGTPVVDLDRLSRRLQSAQLRYASLLGQARELQTQKSRLEKSISLAKARLELAPQAAEAFTYLQEKAHKRAVSHFEDLLSAFVEDVIPDAGRIRLELGTERNAPALDILIDNGGDLETIIDGNGGGLTNVVVTGLGYSALSRTANRQLMLLDEPDCWLQAVNVPAFTKVISEVANPREEADGSVLPGCQTLMISHNDLSLMDDGAHIQALRKEYDLAAYAAREGVDVVHVGTPGPCAYVVWVDRGIGSPPVIEVRYRDDPGRDTENNALTKGFPYLASIGGARAWLDDTQQGIRWIEVMNLGHHVHTMMHLSSGLNVLTGSVNCGKSTLYYSALRAMAYGETSETMIRHGADSAIIRMGLEGGVVLEMVRQRKGSPKVLYRLYDSTRAKPIHEGRQENRGGVPTFISEALRVLRVDDLDIQLRNQKEPVFLLNESAPRRAQLLSVGRESSLLQEVIEVQRQQVRRDKETCKREEIELNSLNRTLMVMGPLAGMAALSDIMSGILEEAMSRAGAAAKIRALVTRMAPLEGKARLHLQHGETLGVSVGSIRVRETGPLASVIGRIERAQRAASLPDLADVPAARPTTDTRLLSKLVSHLHRGAGPAMLANMVPDMPVIPVLRDTDRLLTLTQRLASSQHAAMALLLLPVAPVARPLTDTRVLRECGVSLSTRAARVAVATKELLEASDAATAGEAELHDHMHELGVCPMCDNHFKVDSHAT
jgi:hypothetical protein